MKYVHPCGKHVSLLIQCRVNSDHRSSSPLSSSFLPSSIITSTNTAIVIIIITVFAMTREYFSNHHEVPFTRPSRTSRVSRADRPSRAFRCSRASRHSEAAVGRLA
eukprot:TRINITY_DN4852_c0_g1_i1.p1 TRINITY_DN4852_c0_g1~~TRINITY_DN4852_c0_g1_i1.p1  ORF type:complete len:106 (-),score=5.81 TRINITY_DN4852_c0_g1_i1:180-497(-)